MPRAKKENRGGDRQGYQGKAYPNRDDLNNGPRTTRPHVAQAANGGRRDLLAEVDAMVAADRQQAQPPAAPQPMPDLSGGTRYPDRPITNGLSTGPGAGPEVLGIVPQNLERFRPLLPALELAASMPDVSVEARNFVRRLRGALGAPNGMQ